MSDITSWACTISPVLKSHEFIQSYLELDHLKGLPCSLPAEEDAKLNATAELKLQQSIPNIKCILTTIC